jgi:hypothetical protein
MLSVNMQSVIKLSVIMQSVTVLCHYAKCHKAYCHCECHYAKCYYAHCITTLSVLMVIVVTRSVGLLKVVAPSRSHIGSSFKLKFVKSGKLCGRNIFGNSPKKILLQKIFLGFKPTIQQLSALPVASPLLPRLDATKFMTNYRHGFLISFALAREQTWELFVIRLFSNTTEPQCQ